MRSTTTQTLTTLQVALTGEPSKVQQTALTLVAAERPSPVYVPYMTCGIRPILLHTFAQRSLLSAAVNVPAGAACATTGPPTASGTTTPPQPTATRQ